MKRREGDPSSIKEKYGKENGTQSSVKSVKPGPEILLEENMRKWVPEDARRGLADLAWNKKALHVDLFKPLAFYGLLFEKNASRKISKVIRI